MKISCNSSVQEKRCCRDKFSSYKRTNIAYFSNCLLLDKWITDMAVRNNGGKEDHYPMVSAMSQMEKNTSLVKNIKNTATKIPSQK